MKSRFPAVAAVLLLAALSAFAQGTITGALTGTVTSDGAPLPGALVTVTSPNLQGTRTAYTDASGNYNMVGLPPGQYSVNITLEGLTPVTRATNVTLSGTARVDADLRVAAVAEAITVTASAPAVMETTEVQANFQKRQIDDLPLQKNVNDVANLAPGVTNNGPGGTMQISGAMASDNLVLVNGATIQDNVRGTTRPLYIQDAIQETTVLSGAISAEFGRFTGGVVNTITKSGGNDFSGSVRDSLQNARWTAQSAAGETRPDDKITNIYEGTFGGRIIRDRLWFFGAGRLDKSTQPSRYSTILGSSDEIFSQRKNPRYEFKLTGQLARNHTLVLDYLNNPFTSTNDTQLPVWEASGIDPTIEQNEDFAALHYNGILSNNLLAEVHVSRRNFTFVGLGGDTDDVYAGTPLRTYYGSNNANNGIANSPWFCGVCDDETRDARYYTGKLTYFLGTKNFGTHNIVGGAERYTELLQANNYQSASGLTVWIYDQVPQRTADGNVLFTWGPGDSVESYRVENPSLGSDLTTDSLFLNDKWDLNGKLSFNIGGRFDRTKAVDQAGNDTANESSFSPRLGVTYDPLGNGRLRLSGTYGRYVGRLSEGVQGAASNAGEPNWYGWFYEGDDAFTGTASQVVQHAVDWWLANGGFDPASNPPTEVDLGGVTTQIRGRIKAPGMNEWTVGAGFQFSPNGYVRADYINRDWNNFYANFTNAQTGQIELPNGTVGDLTLVGNTDAFTRNYRAIQLQASDRFLNSRLQVGGSYTYAKLRGNVEGETSDSGPVSTGGWTFTYPEYQGFTANAPVGYLDGDQRHKLRAWAGYDLPIGPAGTLNFSVLERYDSGRPYSAVSTIPAVFDASAGSVDYATPPTTVTYYFSKRGEFRWDDVTRTDFSVNYRLPVFHGSEFFVEAEVFNLFNEQAQIGGSTSIFTARNTTAACTNGSGAAVRCAAFNPFTDTPVEGVNWAKSSTFGQATGLSSQYQLPRMYQFSLGLRF
ncbi:MAG: TonB-dependent receptor [Acidobacteria bacterium]|nr:TonB-dependent receptor [Acidobacteriota bacterium]MBV9477937.1 TonB-dependent receptor [Acidobacteriota bacterium]